MKIIIDILQIIYNGTVIELTKVSASLLICSWSHQYHHSIVLNY